MAAGRSAKHVAGQPAQGPPAPGPLRYHLVRIVLSVLAHAYVRFRFEGVENLPDEPYILCINHPSWLDPIVLAAAWPDSRRLSIFGPREVDMSVGARNHLITWTRRGVPFQPKGGDILDATRRAAAVLRRGDLLVVAGEGRLSDEENRILPLESGVAHFAMLAKVPVVPTAIVGTRWVRFGGTVRFRIGKPLRPGVGSAGRGGAAAFTERLQEQLQGLLEGVQPAPPPGPFGRWLSELFNDRPWLLDRAATAGNQKESS
jgi:1-acyl-sn-glycerol-3-phosphate acyltransferase